MSPAKRRRELEGARRQRERERELESLRRFMAPRIADVVLLAQGWGFTTEPEAIAKVLELEAAAARAGAVAS